MANQAQTGQGTQQTPPPIPGGASYYVAIDGQQSGPHNKAGLTDLAAKQVLTRERLVWEQGLSDWVPSGGQADLQDLWTITPPPLPKQRG